MSLISMSLILLAELYVRQYPCRNPASGSEGWTKDLASPLTLAEKASSMCDEPEASIQASNEGKSGRQAIAEVPCGGYANICGNSPVLQDWK